MKSNYLYKIHFYVIYLSGKTKGWKSWLIIILKKTIIDPYSWQKTGHELHYARSFEEHSNSINLFGSPCFMFFV